MRLEDFAKPAFAVVLGAVSAAVGWLLAKFFQLREKALLLERRVEVVEVALKEGLSKEDVREVLKEEFAERNKTNAERHKQRDELLALKFKQAALEAVQACREGRVEEREKEIRREVKDQIAEEREKSGRLEEEE